MHVIVTKIKEVLFSVLPIILIVIALNFTVSPVELTIMLRFLVGSLLVIGGLTLFLLGVDIGITPLGHLTGTSLAKTDKLWMVLTAGIILGFSISIAEPGLIVLGNQVDTVTSGQIAGTIIVVIVSIGLAVMLMFGFLRIFFSFPLYKLLIMIYALIFILTLFTSREFLAIAFDASGATTGILSVPFILSLSVGISKLKRDSKAAEKDSFGLIAIASTGAIISVMILNIFSTTSTFTPDLNSEVLDSSDIILPFVRMIPRYIGESFMAIIPLIFILLVLQRVLFNLKKRELRRLMVGFLYAFVGLLLFLLGVNGGFMDIAVTLGNDLAVMDNKLYIIIIGFILGAATILAEPAVHVLTHQIEEVTSGYVSRKPVLTALTIGIGFAVSLSVIRVLVEGIQLWHFLLPGYIVCLGMTFFTPKLFVGIAFDAGGVATGPMTATFILAFIQGAANAFESADLMADGFGMIAMVAMTPIITLQVLGVIFAIKSNRKGV